MERAQAGGLASFISRSVKWSILGDSRAFDAKPKTTLSAGPPLKRPRSTCWPVSLYANSGRRLGWPKWNAPARS